MGDERETTGERRRSITLRKKLLLLCFGCLVGGLFAELLVRALGVSYPQPYVPDGQLGSRLQPGFVGWFTREGFAHVHVNSRGFRDVEHNLQKPDGVYRIAVLGDSYAEAVQVQLDETFWSVLENELSTEERPVEVLNFGIAGFGTAQELEALRHVALGYQPDLVLLAFLSGNDIRNNSRELEPVKVRPFYELNDAALELDTSFRQHPDFVKAQQPFTQFKVDCINSSRLLQLVMQMKAQRGDAGDAKEVGLNAEIYREPEAKDWKDAWTLTERLLEETAKVSQANGAEFVVVTLTNAAQVHPDPQQRKKFAKSVGVQDLYYPERRISDLGQSANFEVVTLAETFAQAAEQDGTWFHGFENTKPGTGHWNADGHRLAGLTIAKAIQSLVVAD